MFKVVLLRHGESTWNKENRFTGWTDVDLSERGREEAREAGRLLKAEGLGFDVAFTSVLKRAIRTLCMALDEMDLMWIPVHNSWRLNERHYGDLQGLNKAETAAKFGEQQVKIWRRSFDTKPPGGESLKDTAERVLPYYEANIKPHIVAGRSIIIAAHGNSLRALVMHLDRLTPEQVLELNIPTGAPLLYEFDSAGTPLTHRYL